MNYIIENDIDFFSELNKELTTDSSDNINNLLSLNEDTICLITREPLTDNYITLECNHKFNYLPLYNEVSNQKINTYLETTYLKINQIKCPYCRNITNNLLPYIYHKDVLKIMTLFFQKM